MRRWVSLKLFIFQLNYRLFVLISITTLWLLCDSDLARTLGFLQLSFIQPHLIKAEQIIEFCHA